MLSIDLIIYIFLFMPLVIWAGLWIRARQGFYQLLAHIPKSVLLCNRAGYVVWWNDQAVKEFPDWCNTSVCVYQVESMSEELWKKYINSLTHHEKSISLPEIKIVNGDRKQHIHAYCSVLPFSASKILLVLDDVTKEADLEERLIQVDKMATLGLLSSSMFHDINNFLSGIMLSVQNMSRKLSVEFFIKKDVKSKVGVDPESLHNLLEEINVFKSLNNIDTAIVQASQISNGVLHYVRKGGGEKEQVSINELIDEVIKIIRIENSVNFAIKQGNLDLDVQFDSNLHDVFIYPIRIEQVFMNLIQNAIYSAMSYSEHAKVIVKTYITDHDVCISVEDNGLGIEKSNLSRIFQPFYTTKNENAGTGLGLYICKQIICDQHSGDIDVDTERDDGVAFIVKLPRE